MATSARSLPNHYDVLGLSPRASQEEIGRAFAREMGMFGARPVTAAAHIGLAFEVLRNPVTRKAYDRALGLTAEPEPRLWTMPAPVRTGRPAFDNVPPPVPEAQPRPEPEPPANERLASIVASLRELAKAEKREAAPDPAREETREPPAEEALAARIEQDLEQLLATSWRDAESASRPHGLPSEWRRPAMAIGACVAAAVTIGALSGMSLKRAEEQPVLNVALPPAKPPRVAAVSTPPAVAEPGAAMTEQPVRPEVAPTRSRHAVSAAAAAPPIALEADAGPPADSAPPQSQPDLASTDQNGAAPAAAEPVATQPVAASLPLSNSVIARTIERIGYACGAVASTVPVEGEGAGVFTVTCTSGQAYKATPLRGRYHFRRLGGR